MQEKRIHEIFQASILLKGAHALVECAGGVALAVTSTDAIRAWVDRATQDELLHDRGDFVANHLLAWAQGFSVQTQDFYAFYLLSHGIVKLALVTGLLREKLWAYPASLGVLGLFIAYQLYRFAHVRDPGLIVLSLLDLIVMALAWHEWRLLRSRLPNR
jgi:uncharacterized membrane protein